MASAPPFAAYRVTSGRSLRRRFACAFALLLPALAYLVLAGPARGDGGLLAAQPAASGGALRSALDATSAPSGASGELALYSAPTGASSPPAPAPGQQAATDQNAGANAAVGQQQPRNIVVSVRINSPGNDGPINQTNLAAGSASGTNTAASNQGAAGAGQPGSQGAETSQTAGSNAVVEQDDAGNIVISIRINSPGNNGAVNQTNTTIAVSNSGNVSITDQGSDLTGGSNPAPTALRTAIPARHAERSWASAKAAPARGRHPASSPTSQHAVPAARPAPKAIAPANAEAPRTAQAPSTAPATTAESRVTQPEPPRRAAPGTSKPRHRGTIERLAGPAVAAVPNKAVDLLGRLPSPAVKSASRSQDVSSAVVLTLIAVLGALALLVGARYLPTATRLLPPRKWRHG
jgi:hypothetical protein